MTPEELRQLVRAGQDMFRRELAQESVDAARRLEKAYKNTLRGIDGAVASFQDAANKPGINGVRLAQDSATRRLKSELQAALDDMSKVIDQQARDLQIGGAAIGRNLGVRALQDVIDGQFAKPSVQEIQALINFVDSAPFQANLAQYGAYHADWIGDTILARAAQGKNPIGIARYIVQYIEDFPLADANRTVRTVQLWSARAGQQAIYQANSDIVLGWLWSSARDRRTCLSCIAMDGSFHSNDEILNDHYIGRCAPVPVTSSVDVSKLQTGEDWFNDQSTIAQREMMGAARWMAWRDGLFDFNQLSVEFNTDVYGKMRRERSLVELIGEQAANQYKQKVA